MSHILTAAPASELTSGNQLFKCAPYNCTMLARACLERQAKAALGLEAITLLKCRGCELGAQVRGRVTDVTFTERELLRGARASGHQRNAGALGEKLKGARTKQTADAPMEKLSPRRALPIVGLEFVAPPTPVELPPAFATAPRISAPMAAEKTKPKEETEEPMPAKSVELKGKEIAGVKVLHQLPQVKGGKGSLWMVQFPCKHEEPVLGAVLTSYERNGSTRGCKICRASNEREAATASRAKAPRAKEPSRAPRKGAKPRPAPARHLPPPSLTGEAEPKTYEFPLRRDFSARVTLPENLTEYDVQRLTRWLDTLVFEEPTAAE